MASNRLAQAARKSLAMGPTVRSLLTQYQLDPSKIISTGPHQTLLKSDVLSYISQKNLKSAQNQTNDIAPSKSQMSKPASSSAGHSTQNLKSKDSIRQVVDQSVLKTRYARKALTDLEIEVINNGGRI